MHTTHFFLVSFMLMSSMTFSQRLTHSSLISLQEIQNTAQQSLDTFKNLVTKENYKHMGFDFIEEIQSATLDTPIIDYLVRLDQFKEYKQGIDPDSLLTATNQVHYPVLVNGVVKSSLTLSKMKGRWQAVSFGSMNLIKMISITLIGSMKTTGIKRSSYFSVRIPALNLIFLGYHLINQLMLVPVMDNAQLDLKAGISLTAETVFNRLLPEAKAHNGMPR